VTSGIWHSTVTLTGSPARDTASGRGLTSRHEQNKLEGGAVTANLTERLRIISNFRKRGSPEVLKPLGPRNVTQSLVARPALVRSRAPLGSPWIVASSSTG
jgi:hypothetical protein